jgi:hypothetical protein
MVIFWFMLATVLVATMEFQLSLPSCEDIDRVVAEVHEQHLCSPQKGTNGDDGGDDDSDIADWIVGNNNGDNFAVI